MSKHNKRHFALLRHHAGDSFSLLHGQPPFCALQIAASATTALRADVMILCFFGHLLSLKVIKSTKGLTYFNFESKRNAFYSVQGIANVTLELFLIAFDGF